MKAGLPLLLDLLDNAGELAAALLIGALLDKRLGGTTLTVLLTPLWYLTILQYMFCPLRIVSLPGVKWLSDQ